MNRKSYKGRASHELMASILSLSLWILAMAVLAAVM